MDTSKRDDPKDTQAVGDATILGLAPPTSGTVPVEDLEISGDALGDPGATGDGSKNSDHIVPKEPATPSTRPTLKHRDRRKTNPPPKYDSYILNTKLHHRDLTKKVADKVTISDDSIRLSRVSSEAGSVSTTVSQAQMQAGIVFNSTDPLLKVLAE